MDIAILCGGRGTRLAELWNGPKCLVPLGDGRPILAHLIQLSRALRPQNLILLAAHKGDEVATAMREQSLIAPSLIILREPSPTGTASAVRLAAKITRGPLLVLNGDTLPRYDLQELAQTWYALRPSVLTAWCAGKRSGALILAADALARLRVSTVADLDQWIDESNFNDHVKIGSKPFLDIGTPEGFALAEKWEVQ